jgi:recombinational DNA repair protein RecR
LLQEAEETLEDCLASRPDELRQALNENLKQYLRRCNHLMDKMHKSDDRYEKELERIQALLPTCPHCEDIKEEELEQMRANYYRDMEQDYTDEYDCTW